MNCITEKQNEVTEIKTVIIDQYRAKQADSFKAVGTDASEWKPCPIIDVTESGPVFEIPVGYKTVTPYKDSLTKDQIFLLHQMLQSSVISGGWMRDVCELCGHPIKTPYPIQNDGKKLLMYVGADCVNNFMGAGYIQNQIKIFKETKLRTLFREWIPLAVEECNKHPTKDWYGRDRAGFIEEPYYNLRKKLFKVKNDREDKINTLSSMKIKNIFKEARALKIPIPEGVNLEGKSKKVTA